MGGGGGRLAQAIFPRSGFLNIPKFVFYGGGGYLETFFLVGGGGTFRIPPYHDLATMPPYRVSCCEGGHHKK